MFKDRKDAGRKLAKSIKESIPLKDAILLALPRGGVPVGYEISKILNIPMRLIIVRKIGAPIDKEFAIGAIVKGKKEEIILNEEVIERLQIDKDYIDETIKKEQDELIRRQKLYNIREFPNLKGKNVILVDDGIATGYSIKAAITAIKEWLPASIVVATPIASKDVIEELSKIVDKVIAVEVADPLWAISIHYQNFDQTSDKEVIDILESMREI